MIVLINIGRIAMVLWVLYSLLLIFAPTFIHRQPNQTSGIVQFVAAYALGYVLDRALGAMRRRRAAQSAPSSTVGGTGGM